ncbi:unnamed protein product [Amoebophrya sp. A120]|nr:unnamed protein product [Amoebophrya sp. A120]|eukprot:GSA120T00019075001.1
MARVVFFRHSISGRQGGSVAVRGATRLSSIRVRNQPLLRQWDQCRHGRSGAVLDFCGAYEPNAITNPRFFPAGANNAGSFRAFSSEAAAVQATQRPRGSRFMKGVFGIGAGVGAGVLYCKYKNEEALAKSAELRKTVIEERIPSRDEMLARLDAEEFDVLVVGGGATGAGLALDATTRGLTTACVEQEDFASGTSSKSTKLLWAGSRYLVKALVSLFQPGSLLAPADAVSEFTSTFNMVLGCFRERSYMLQLNSHLTYWVPVAVPIKHWVIWPPPFGYPPAAIGPACGLYSFFFKGYDALGYFAAPSSYTIFPRKLQEAFPQMDAPRLKYANVFYEGAHNDARTNLAIACTAMLKGAAVTNYTVVEKIVFDKNGHARGAVCRDALSGKKVQIRAKKIIYCAGPFTDDVRKLSEGLTPEEAKKFQPCVTGAGGTHIVLPENFCPRDLGMCDMQTSRGSFMFYLPWQGHTLVGTTDVKTSNPELHPAVPEDDVEYLLKESCKYLAPSMHPRREDVLSAWYGTRPLAKDPNDTSTTNASRDHTVSYNAQNDVTFVSGGKWTTWREMAEDALDKVLLRSDEALQAKAGPCVTLDTPLLGAGRNGDFAPQGWTPTLSAALARQFRLPPDQAAHLVNTYGTRAADVLALEKAKIGKTEDGNYASYPLLTSSPNCPFLECEVRYAVQTEHACTAADILARRTRLAFVNSNAAHLAVGRVVDIMGEELGWNSSRKQQEVDACHAVLTKDFLGPVPRK